MCEQDERENPVEDIGDDEGDDDYTEYNYGPGYGPAEEEEY